MSPNNGGLKEEVKMKTTLFRFYLIFMLVSLALFSFENKSVNKREVKDNKETDISNKKPYRHHYRFSNLC